MCVLVTLTSGTCTKQENQKLYVARVDQALLTQEELSASHDSVGDISHQNREYINNWITDELLYQEAVKRGLSDSDELHRKLEAIRKHLAIDALLQKELYGADTSFVNEDAIVSLYNAGGRAFFLKEDVLNLSYALFSERDAANSFRSKILEGASWETALVQFQHDSLLAQQLLQVASRQYFTEPLLYPAELWKLARTLQVNEVSFVLKTDTGYFVLLLHGLKKQGEMPDLNYIKNELRDRVMIDQRRLAYEKLLANLRAHHSVEVRIDLSDTSASVKE